MKKNLVSIVLSFLVVSPVNAHTFLLPKHLEGSGLSMFYSISNLSKPTATIVLNSTGEQQELLFGSLAQVDVSYRMYGLNFGPFLNGQDPNLPSQIPEDQLRARMRIIAPYVAWVRTFGTSHGLEKAALIAKNLKAIRSERIKRIEDGKNTFSGYVKMLENEKERRAVGAEMEIMRHAKDMAKTELGKLHTYVDGTVDRPFLTPEIVLEND